MKECSSFSQNRKLVVIVVRGAFFIVEVLSYCRSASRIGLRKVTISLSLVSYCFWYALFHSILPSTILRDNDTSSL